MGLWNIVIDEVDGTYTMVTYMSVYTTSEADFVENVAVHMELLDPVKFGLNEEAKP